MQRVKSIKKNQSIYLINAGNNKGISSIANDYSFPPLGVIALGSFINEQLPDFQVTVRDGSIMEDDEIASELEKLKPGVVAISTLSTSYSNALTIARIAHSVGAVTVLGNDHAAQLNSKILLKRDFIDFIVCSEYGEKTLELLLRELIKNNPNVERIPELAYRTGDDKIVSFNYEKDAKLLGLRKSKLYAEQKSKYGLDQFPIVNRNLLPRRFWSTYLANYNKKFSSYHKNDIQGVTTMNRVRGCSRGGTIHKCKHCDMLLDVSFSSPKFFWNEVIEAHRQVEANVFYEVCDSFSSFPRFIESLLKGKPKNIDFEPLFFVYVQARDIVSNPRLIPMLKELGVFRVNIGLEAGSDKTLKHMKGNRDSVAQNTEALAQLSNHGIATYGSLVLGTDEESKETLDETVTWAKMLLRNWLISEIEVQPILPLPQNFYGKKLIKAGLLTEDELESDHPWHSDKVSRFYVDRFSSVSFDAVIDAARAIRQEARTLKILEGSAVSLAAHY